MNDFSKCLFFSFVIVTIVGCKQRLESEILDSLNTSLKKEDYINICQKKTGLPEKLSCFDENSYEVPIFIKGKPFTQDDIYTTLKYTKEKTFRSNYTDFLYNQSVPYSRIVRYDLPNSTCVLLCRKTFLEEKVSLRFDDINMICHNPTTGDTCFHNANLVTAGSNIKTKRFESPTRSIPIPNDIDDKELNFWMSPSELKKASCTSCHSADPFVHTPFVDNVQLNGSPIVPSYPFGNYRIVYGEYFSNPCNGDERTPKRERWPQLKQVTHKDIQPCISCHRIGSLHSGRSYSGLSLINDLTGGGINGFSRSKYEKWHFMPPSEMVHNVESEAVFLKAMNAIKKCANDGTLNVKHCDYKEIRPNDLRIDLDLIGGDFSCENGEVRHNTGSNRDKVHMKFPF